MKKILWICLIGLLSCQTQQEDSTTFELDVSLQGIKENSLIILSIDEKKGELIDSARVVNGKVRFSGKLNSPAPGRLIVAGTNNTKYLWLEPSKMSFKVENGNLKEGLLAGSEGYLKDKELDKRLRPFELIQEKLEAMDEDYIVSNFSKPQIDSMYTIYTKAEKDEEYEIMSFIRENPSSYYTTHLLDFYATTFGRDSVQSLFFNLTNEMKMSIYGKSIQDYLKVNVKLDLGDSFPHITLKNTNDEEKNSGDIKAKYLLIEFWASNCGPCRLTNPKLVNIYKKYQSKGFDIYGISLDTSKEAWLQAYKKDGLLWENVVDLTGSHGKTASKYGIYMLPHNFLLDEEGKIIAIDIWSEDLEKKLETLLP